MVPHKPRKGTSVSEVYLGTFLSQLRTKLKKVEDDVAVENIMIELDEIIW